MPSPKRADPYDYRTVEFLLHLAKKSPQVYQHSAMIIHRGKVVSIGYNKLVNCPTKRWKTGERGMSIHAEIDAIDRAGRIPKGAIIIVARRSEGTGQQMNSKPCPRCAMVLKKLGLKAYWTDTDGTVVTHTSRKSVSPIQTKDVLHSE